MAHGAYYKMFPSYWNGETGRRLRQAGKDAQLLGTYLCFNHHANSLGLYYLPLPYIPHELALTPNEVKTAMTELCKIEFAQYDLETEFVWVVNMALIQLGESLKPTDNRVPAIHRLYSEIRPNPFLPLFFDKYSDRYLIEIRRDYEGPYKPLTSPFEAPSKGPKSKNKNKSRYNNLSDTKNLTEGGGSGFPDDFETFWSIYPRRIGKIEAYRQWNISLKGRPARGKVPPIPAAQPEELIAAAKHYQLSVQGREPEYIKLPSTFLGQDAHWKDYVKAPIRGVGKRSATDHLNDWSGGSRDRGVR